MSPSTDYLDINSTSSVELLSLFRPVLEQAAVIRSVEVSVRLQELSGIISNSACQIFFTSFPVSCPDVSTSFREFLGPDLAEFVSLQSTQCLQMEKKAQERDEIGKVHLVYQTALENINKKPGEKRLSDLTITVVYANNMNLSEDKIMIVKAIKPTQSAINEDHLEVHILS